MAEETYLFKLLNGRFVDTDLDHTYIAGQPGNDIIRSTRRLDLSFPNNYLLLNDSAELPDDPHYIPPEERGPQKENPEVVGEAKKLANSERADVTSKFPTAQENSLLVFMEDFEYWIAESGEVEEYINEESLSKQQVAPWIQKYVDGKDTDTVESVESVATGESSGEDSG